MWDFFTATAWVLSIAIFAWLIFDFFRVNMRYSEDVLLSSREGVDELFAESGQEH
jgi:hypothetical protein